MSFCSHDSDARVGYATRGFARGYKLHALASSDGRILRHALRPMNEGEAKVARGFAGDDVGGWVLADANYDTKNLYQAFGAYGRPIADAVETHCRPSWTPASNGSPSTLCDLALPAILHRLSSAAGSTRRNGADLLEGDLFWWRAGTLACLGPSTGSRNTLGRRQNRHLPRPFALPEDGSMRGLHAKSSSGTDSGFRDSWCNLTILAPNARLYARAIVSAYRYRWDTKTMFEQLRLNYGLGDYWVLDEQGILCHVHLCAVALLLLPRHAMGALGAQTRKANRQVTLPLTGIRCESARPGDPTWSNQAAWSWTRASDAKLEVGAPCWQHRDR